VQNVRSPPGIYIVTTVPDARLLVLLEDCDTGYECSFIVTIYEGLRALCFCAAQNDNLMVSLELVQDDHRFATYGFKKNTVAIVSEYAVNGFREEADILAFSVREWKTVMSGCCDLAARGELHRPSLFYNWQYLNKFNFSRELCSHDRRRWPVPPPWYKKALGFRDSSVKNQNPFPEMYDIDRLFYNSVEV
jgi:hypothetical protein